MLTGGGSPTSDSADLFVWSAQYEAGILATRPIVTQTVVVTASPSYWPAIGDGFEPVYDPAPGLLVFLNDWQGLRQLYPNFRTNVALRSEEFDNAAWTKSNCTITANAIAAPDGTTTADKLIENVANAQHQAGQSFTAAAGSTVTISCWYKAAERTQGYLFFNNKDNLNPGCRYDLVAGTVLAQNGGATGTITAYPDGWFRCTCSGPAGTGATGPSAWALTVNAAGAVVYAGDGTSGMYVWGFQTELPLSGSAATPYIKTTTASVLVTDYSLPGSGIVALGVAPIAGAALSWTGSYYRRCRVNSDAVESERIFNQIWKTGHLELISVKP
jgi:hypothetical protein